MSRSDKSHPFSIGLIIEELHMLSINEHGSIISMNTTGTPETSSGFIQNTTETHVGVILKQLLLSNFGIYWDFDTPDSIDLSTIPSFKTQMNYAFLSLHQPLEELPFEAHSLLPTYYILEPLSMKFRAKMDIRAPELRHPSIEESIQGALTHSPLPASNPTLAHVLSCYQQYKQQCPFSATFDDEYLSFIHYYTQHQGQPLTEFETKWTYQLIATVYQQYTTIAPLAQIEGSISTIHCTIEKNQYRDVISFISNLSIQTLKAKYKRDRPSQTVLENVFCSPNSKRILATCLVEICQSFFI